MMEPIKVVLRYTRDSKNAHRYDQEGVVPGQTLVPTVYLPKIFFGPDNPPPMRITVVVETASLTLSMG